MRSKRNGFTIVEVVISLAVIAIVSLTATSIILSGIKIQKNAHDEFFAVNLCENSVAIFRAAADDKTDAGNVCNSFQKNMEDLLEITLSGTYDSAGYEKETYFSAERKPIESADGAAYSCKLSLREESGVLKFSVQVSAGSKLLCEMAYSMVGGAA